MVKLKSDKRVYRLSFSAITLARLEICTLGLTVWLVGSVIGSMSSDVHTSRSLFQAEDGITADVPACPRDSRVIAQSETNTDEQSACAWTMGACLDCPNRCIANSAIHALSSAEPAMSDALNAFRSCDTASVERTRITPDHFNQTRVLSAAEATKLVGCVTKDELAAWKADGWAFPSATVSAWEDLCTNSEALSQENADLYNARFSIGVILPAGAQICLPARYSLETTMGIIAHDAACDYTAESAPLEGECLGDSAPPVLPCVVAGLSLLKITPEDTSMLHAATVAIHEECSLQATQEACHDFQPAGEAEWRRALARVNEEALCFPSGSVEADGTCSHLEGHTATGPSIGNSSANGRPNVTVASRHADDTSGTYDSIRYALLRVVAAVALMVLL